MLLVLWVPGEKEVLCVATPVSSAGAVEAGSNEMAVVAMLQSASPSQVSTAAPAESKHSEG